MRRTQHSPQNLKNMFQLNKDLTAVHKPVLSDPLPRGSLCLVWQGGCRQCPPHCSDEGGGIHCSCSMKGNLTQISARAGVYSGLVVNSSS